MGGPAATPGLFRCRLRFSAPRDCSAEAFRRPPSLSCVGLIRAGARPLRRSDLHARFGRRPLALPFHFTCRRSAGGALPLGSAFEGAAPINGRTLPSDVELLRASVRIEHFCSHRSALGPVTGPSPPRRHPDARLSRPDPLSSCRDVRDRRDCRPDGPRPRA